MRNIHVTLYCHGEKLQFEITRYDLIAAGNITPKPTYFFNPEITHDVPRIS